MIVYNLHIFYIDYYPIISCNINIDKKTQTLIMGSIAYNMNVPKSLYFYKERTDDIDIKIYTTNINYLYKLKISLK